MNHEEKELQMRNKGEGREGEDYKGEETRYERREDERYQMRTKEGREG